MKQTFDWLRERLDAGKEPEYDETDASFNEGLNMAISLINEAEAKWEADCCEWYERNFEDSFYYSHSCKEFDYKNDVKCWNFCPYCGKPIKISEVE